SLCEALQVGTPSVATYIGGIPSLVQHGRTGLMFPAGDAAMLADSIARIFRDDDFAAHLGLAARMEASERHNPRRVASPALEAYYDLAARDGASAGRAPELVARKAH